MYKLRTWLHKLIRIISFCMLNADQLRSTEHYGFLGITARQHTKDSCKEVYCKNGLHMYPCQCIMPWTSDYKEECLCMEHGQLPCHYKEACSVRRCWPASLKEACLCMDMEKSSVLPNTKLEMVRYFPLN